MSKKNHRGGRRISFQYHGMTNEQLDQQLDELSDHELLRMKHEPTVSERARRHAGRLLEARSRSYDHNRRVTYQMTHNERAF